MKKSFKPSRWSTRALIIIVIILSMPPPIASLAMADSHIIALIICLIIYAAYSPIIVVLIRIIVRNLRGRIVISADGIESITGRNRISMKWDEISSFLFDYIGIPNQAFGITRNYALYEIAGAPGKFRFYHLLSKKERKSVPDIFMIAPLQKKAFALDSYGLYLDRKECHTLVNYIRDYMEAEPQRKAGLF